MAVIKTSARMVPMLPEKAKPGTTVCVKNTSEEAAEIRMCECAEFWRQRKGERKSPEPQHTGEADGQDIAPRRRMEEGQWWKGEES